MAGPFNPCPPPERSEGSSTRPRPVPWSPAGDLFTADDLFRAILARWREQDEEEDGGLVAVLECRAEVCSEVRRRLEEALPGVTVHVGPHYGRMGAGWVVEVRGGGEEL